MPRTVGGDGGFCPNRKSTSVLFGHHTDERRRQETEAQVSSSKTGTRKTVEVLVLLCSETILLRL